MVRAGKGASVTQITVASNNIAEIRDTHTSELVIALCGPIGSPINRVALTFKEWLEGAFGYSSAKILKLSHEIEKHGGSAPSKSEYERIKFLIDKGDELRQKHGGSVLAELAVGEIAIDRQKSKDGSEMFEPRRVCHIIDSIKNQQELDLLRLVYRDMVYVVGVYAPQLSRAKSLEQKGMTQAEIYTLIDRDSGEEFAHGQTVRDTFPNADFFLRIDSNSDSQMKARVERFLNLILGVKVMTPTYAETAMYAAASAAGNSACLSRQVGAAITDKRGDVIATGWNDVPKFGGGLYAADPGGDPNKTDHDQRCWNNGGKCYNDDEKHLIAKKLVDELSGAGVILESDKEKAKDAILTNGKLKSLIEFSRSVHAEMHAIINAGKNGATLAGSELFVTTYPCHSCATHIIAAGITEVYFIEPYRKSLATRLHDDAITEDESNTNKVRLLPYDGVAPSRYLKLFMVPRDSRKLKGSLMKIDPRDSQPRFDKTLEALPTLEALVVKGLKKKNLIKAE